MVAQVAKKERGTKANMMKDIMNTVRSVREHVTDEDFQAHFEEVYVKASEVSVHGKYYEEHDRPGRDKPFSVFKKLDSHCLGKVHLQTNRGTWCISEDTRFRLA